jgi:aminopeptidase-like protein/aminoglycoside N3'-acetyltransferase
MSRIRKVHYTKADLVAALRSVGLKPGQVVFSHSNIGFFGIPAEGNDRATADRIVLEAFEEVLGPEGTLVVPTYTYSFCKREVFDPSASPSTCGAWSEFVRTRPDACRSCEPIFSVAALGARARELTHDMPAECFGPESFWDRLFKADGVICNLNVWVISTFIHYVEKRLNVPYRFDKVFPGVLSVNGAPRKGAVIFFCQDMTNPDTRVATEAFDALALETGCAQKASVGRGYLTAISARAMAQLIEETLPQQPYLLIEAGKTGTPPVLLRPAREFAVKLPAAASMMEMIEGLWELPRDIVSDGYDAALTALARQVPMQIHSYPTGTHCWTWLIPEKWSCHEAWLETMDGTRLFSYADNPLHVVSYSLPFDGIVSREELLNHLHIHPILPDAAPFIFKYYEREWGLCCSRALRDSLKEAQYRVVIRSDFRFGELKVGEIVVPGESDETVVLCAHLCHPGQVNDDLTGVVVGMEVMRRLQHQPKPYYTYRLLILPETIGSVAWLSHNESLIPKIKGGLFIEMPGRSNPPTLQSSFAGDTEIDLCFRLAMKALRPDTVFIPFMTMNDERQFNAPGVRIPMLALYRIMPTGHAEWPYREYHSTDDTPQKVPPSALDETVAMVLGMVDTLEQNVIPVNQFKGEIFLSRFGLHVDWYENREANEQLFNILYRVDGTRSLARIAHDLGISFNAVKIVVDQLHVEGLVALRREPLA